MNTNTNTQMINTDIKLKMDNNSSIAWVSVDPVWNRLSIYPFYISNLIEIAFRKYMIENGPPLINLETQYYDATIHFSKLINGKFLFYQTTPGKSFGARFIHKQPGFRSVERLEFENSTSNFVCTIYSGTVSGEWRIVDTEEDSEHIITERIPADSIINNQIFSLENTFNIPEISYWEPEHLKTETDSTVNNLNVYVWQWCRGTPEKQGNVMILDNNWWTPYLYEQNKKIQEDFYANLYKTTIKIPCINSERTIVFQYNSCYGHQYNNTRDNIRIVRRIIITVKELKEILNNINSLPVDIGILSHLTLDSDTIPQEFYCCITQDIMTDPVQTIDNHTYDRHSIEQWFVNNSTSPLTGLILSDKNLMPNTVLKLQIEKCTKEKMDQSIFKSIYI